MRLAVLACAAGASLGACAAPPRGTSIAADASRDASVRLPAPLPRPAIAVDASRRSPIEVPPPTAATPAGATAPATERSESPAEPVAGMRAAVLTPAIGQRLVSNARNYLGAPYRRGGRDPRGVDCSGLVQLVFAQESIPLPRTCEAQARVGEPVPVSEAQPGDLLFFAEGRATVTHVGIYAGDGEFIHASTGAGRVRIDELDDRYFAVRLREARRVVSPR